jgi:hypothetical protein
MIFCAPFSINLKSNSTFLIPTLNFCNQKIVVLILAVLKPNENNCYKCVLEFYVFCFHIRRVRLIVFYKVKSVHSTILSIVDVNSTYERIAELTLLALCISIKMTCAATLSDSLCSDLRDNSCSIAEHAQFQQFYQGILIQTKKFLFRRTFFLDQHVILFRIGS